jgi:hypothetical protein
MLSLFLSLSMIGTVMPMNSAYAVTGTSQSGYNYGEALQKSLMFYELQRSGKLPEDRRDNWRGDSGLNDGKDNGLDLTGGFYDAGDHVKFNLPMSYSSTMLAWSVYEAKDQYTKSGQLKYALNDIKWANDYFIKCHPSPNVYYYQVGDGVKDHGWWGPAEVMQMDRPSYKVDLNNPGATVVAETAASLASASVVFKDSDADYSALCLKHAKELFNFADTTRSDSGYTAANDYYKSYSGCLDDLAFAAVWLYMATNDKTYLDKAESCISSLGTDAYKWAQSWDDVRYGAILMLAKLTNKPIYKQSTERHLDWWSVGYNGDKIKYTPKGLAFLTEWGSLRYAEATAFLALVYSDWSGCDASKATAYKSFAKSQVDYALGSSGRSFVVGFGQNAPTHPHHRTSQGSWDDDKQDPVNSRHVLYGALVGGPGGDDSYVDTITDYTKNEVACDYNAGFTGALVKLYGSYGGDPIANFNANEVKTNNEYFVEAKVNSSGNNFVEIDAFLNNKSGWPARVSDKLSFRYYMDLTEVINAGYTANDITVSTGTNEGATVSKPIAYDVAKNIYYVNVDFSGTKIYPGGKSAYRKEIVFRVSAPSSVVWNNSNDFSYKELSNSGALTVCSNIPVYEGSTKLFGTEPINDVSMTAKITSPVNGAVFDQFSTTNPIVISSDATISKGTISKVEFYANDAKLGEATAAPYKANWVPTGYTTNLDGYENIALYSKVIDSLGNSLNSEKVNIKVKLPIKPAPQPQGNIKVQAFNGITSGSTNSISPKIKLTNTGTTAINLSDVKLRYYYTIDGDKGQSFWCDWATVGSSNVTGTFQKLASPKTNADYYLEVGFPVAAGLLNPSQSVELSLRFAKNDWSNYNQSNDYSFNASSSGYTDYNKITCYVSNNLVFGIEP